MRTIEVFEAAPSAKSPVSSFERDAFESRLQWLGSRGVKVQRHALPGDDRWDALDSTVKSAFEAQGPDCLPMVTLDGNIISVAGYPTAIELMEMIGTSVGIDPDFFGIIAFEAAALGAAIASNDFPAFRQQWKRLRSLGMRDKDASRVVQSATVTAASTMRDDMRTRVEQLLAFGPLGRPPKTCCACSSDL